MADIATCGAAKVGDLVQALSKRWTGLYRVQSIQGSFTAVLEDYFTREFKGNWAIKDLKIIQAYPVAPPTLRLQESKVECKAEQQSNKEEVMAEKTLEMENSTAQSTKHVALSFKEVEHRVGTGELLEKKASNSDLIFQAAKQDDTFTTLTITSIIPAKDIDVKTKTEQHTQHTDMNSQQLSSTQEQAYVAPKRTSLPLRLKEPRHIETQEHNPQEVQLFASENQPDIYEMFVLIRSPATVSRSHLCSCSHHTFEPGVAI